MKITGLTLEQFTDCVWNVSYARYSANVFVHADADDLPDAGGVRVPARKQCRARLAVTGSRGPGSRTAANGRHGPYACWHACRDVLQEVFRRYPDAVIVAGHAWRITYRGKAEFEELYPGTALVSIGSPAGPVTMPELCECPRWYRAVMSPLGTGELSAFGEYAREASEPLMSAETIAQYRRRRPPVPVVQVQWQSEAAERIERVRQQYNPRWEAIRYRPPRRTAREADSTAADADAGYVSPAVRAAAEQYARSAELLGDDKPADPWVFGPDYDYKDDPYRYSR